MINMQGTPHAFFTLTAADLQWPDLHAHMPVEIEVPEGDARALRRQRRLALNTNPNLAATYLDHRVQLYLKHFLFPALGARHFWYRYEWQDRGSGHIHGFVWMKDAPDVAQIDWDLLKKPDTNISAEQQKRMDDFVTYWDQKITAWNPAIPRPDAPRFGTHPCSRLYSDLAGTKAELAELLNWVQRHTECKPGYCEVKRKIPGTSTTQTACRFDYPFECADRAKMGLDSKGRVRFEPRRNDPVLNAHNRAMIFTWNANTDIKPVISKDAALR